MPLDPEPVEKGNIELVDGVAYYTKPDVGVARHVSHFSTCPEATKWRR